MRSVALGMLSRKDDHKPGLPISVPAAQRQLGYAELLEVEKEKQRNRQLHLARAAAFTTSSDASQPKKAVTFTSSLPTLVSSVRTAEDVSDRDVRLVQQGRDRHLVTEPILEWPRYLTSHVHGSAWPRTAVSTQTMQQSGSLLELSRFARGDPYRDVSVAPSLVGSGWHHAAPKHLGGRVAADMLIVQTLAAEDFVDSLIESCLAKETTAIVKETIRSIVWDHVEARPLNELFGRLVDEIIRETVLSTLTVSAEPGSVWLNRRDPIKHEVSSLAAGMFMDALQVEYFLALLSGHADECDGVLSNRRDFGETFLDSMILEVLLREAIHLTHA